MDDPTSPRTPSKNRFGHTLLVNVPKLSTPPSRRRPSALSSSPEINAERTRSPAIRSPTRLVTSSVDTLLPTSPSKIGGLCVGKDGTEDIHPFAVFSGVLSVNLDEDQLPYSPLRGISSPKALSSPSHRSPVVSPTLSPVISPSPTPLLKEITTPTNDLLQSIMNLNAAEDDHNPFLYNPVINSTSQRDRDVDGFEGNGPPYASTSARPPMSPPPKSQSQTKKGIFLLDDNVSSIDRDSAKPSQERNQANSQHEKLEWFPPFIESGSMKGKLVNVPKFYFPRGESTQHQYDACEDTLRRVRDIYGDRDYVDEREFIEITKACGLPRYVNITFFRVSTEVCRKSDLITYEDFEDVWKALLPYHEDEYALAFELLRKENVNFLTPEDFLPIMEDVLFNHPGLDFLSENPLFQDRYIETVICRMFYDNRCWNDRMTLAQFRRSNLLTILRRLELGMDLNLTHDIFSYKHFYVIYCKFWELDTNHDLLIDFEDLSNYCGGALTDRILSRVIEGYGKRTSGSLDGMGEPKMSYLDFIWFILSEVDKTSATAIEYWFRCLDLDGDCILSTFELEYFYEEQMHIMRENKLEVTSFADIICQMNDLVRPSVVGQMTLGDIKCCKMAPQFFDTFINLGRALSHENHQQMARLKMQLRALQQQCVDEAAKYALENEHRLVELLGSESPDAFEFTPWCMFAESEYQFMVKDEMQEGSLEGYQGVDLYEDERLVDMMMAEGDLLESMQDVELGDGADVARVLFDRVWLRRDPAQEFPTGPAASNVVDDDHGDDYDDDADRVDGGATDSDDTEVEDGAASSMTRIATLRNDKESPVKH